MFDYVLDKCNDGFFAYCGKMLKKTVGTEITTGYFKNKKGACDEISRCINKMGWNDSIGEMQDRT